LGRRSFTDARDDKNLAKSNGLFKEGKLSVIEAVRPDYYDGECGNDDVLKIVRAVNVSPC
jgi:hypothetical protein